MRVWVNGRLLADPREPVLPVTDHGFTVGDGVFEAVKVLHGQPFALTRHLDRLITSARGLGLPEPDLDAVREGIKAVLEGQELPLGRLRVTFTDGSGPMGSGRHPEEPTTLVVVADAMAPWPQTAAAVTVPWPRNERGALAGLKTTSYAENVVALHHAHQRGASEAIFANLAGHVCEGTGTNVMYVVDGELRTPSLASGCLAGVTRDLLLQWAAEEMPVREVDEGVEILKEASEVLLVSTTRDVQGVHRLDDRELAAPGPVTLELTRLWREREAEGMDP